MKSKAFFNWSGGKDSALALYTAQQQQVPVEALVTTVNAVANRISMHGVRRELLVSQSKSIGLPLHTIELPEMPGMQSYEEAVHCSHQQLKASGYTHGVFGDIFLEDLKTYREDLLAKDNLQCLFPIWKRDTKELIQQFIKTGFKAIIVCVNSSYLNSDFCGRLLDESFVTDLPSGIDPCGENGEYHSFVFDGPNFSAPVGYKKGEMVFKEYAPPKNCDDCFTTAKPAAGFYFQDLIPV